MKCRFAAAATVIGVTLASASVHAQGYDLRQTVSPFVSVAGSGTQLSFSSTDDGTARFSLPFPFEFFGDTLPMASNVYVSTNGTVHFGASFSSPTNRTIPTSGAPENFIAVFWDDLSALPSTARGWWHVSGPPSNQVLTVEWSGFVRLGTADSISMQVKLHEQSGLVEFIYGSRTGGSSASGTVGIEGPMGMNGEALPCGNTCDYSDVASGRKYTFTPRAPPPMIDLMVTAAGTPPAMVADGGSVNISYTVRNSGMSMSASTDVRLTWSTSQTVMPSQVVAMATVPALAPSASSNGSLRGNLPQTNQPGQRLYLTVIVDATQTQMETDETNNERPAGQTTIAGGSSGFRITTVMLPNGSVGSPYSSVLQTAGGSGTVTWRVLTGSLPSGLTLSSAGRISGTPSQMQMSTFRVEARAGSQTATADLNLQIDAGGGLRLTTTNLPMARVGESYTAMLMATGGSPPYAFQAVGGAPMWLTIVSDGQASGLPSAPGVHDIAISIFDSMGSFAQTTVRLEVVQGGPLSIVTTATSPPDGFTLRAYAFTFKATGGRTPYRWDIAEGQLASGLNLDMGTGELAGTPDTPGASMFTVRVTDGAGDTDTLPVSIEISELTRLEIDLPSTLLVPLDMPADVMLRARGGVPPYSWSIVTGTLPSGLRLSGDRITGTTSSSIARAVTLEVSDDETNTDRAQVTVRATMGGGQLDAGVMDSGTSTTGGTDPNPGNGRRGAGGNVRRGGGGCQCATPPAPGSWFALAMLGLVFGAWRRRRVVFDRARPRR